MGLLPLFGQLRAIIYRVVFINNKNRLSGEAPLLEVFNRKERQAHQAALTAGFLFFFSCAALCGEEWMPWTEKDLELYPQCCYLYQNYKDVATSSGTQHRHGDDHFFAGALSTSFAAWSAEIEAIVAETRRQHACLDSVRITGRYQWLSDTVGDPVALMTGITIIKATTSALHDISSFHQGKFAGEMFVSIGKERPCWDDWLSRWWGGVGIGLGDHGAPWIRGRLAWEKNFHKTLHARLFLNALLGLGSRSLSVNDFDGYGTIQHRSVDVGFRISKRTDFCGIYRLGYARRIYAYNFPKAANLFLLSFVYPMGL
ncbi:MAG: hypothetical protein WB791_04605 [Waddliaceae bacterium]